MKKIICICLLSFLCSCASGPIHVAKNQTESIKSNYEDAKLKMLYAENESLMNEIYNRFAAFNVNFYKEGIGFTVLKGDKNERLNYLMINIRPGEVFFNEGTSKPEQRFSDVLQMYFPKYLNHVKKSDIDRKGIDGLAMGIYWPVRDYSQCNQYGGFLEYIHVYFSREDVIDYLERRKLFKEVINDSEVITSLELQPAKTVRPMF